MRPYLPIALTLFAVIAVSCKTPSVKGYWDKHTPDITNINAAEDEFAAFAELAVADDPEAAHAEIDRLFDILRKDEVAYYVYTHWVVSAFYSQASPCHSCPLFVYSMERILGDGIIDGYDAELFTRFITACKTNKPGQKAVLPTLHDTDGNIVDFRIEQPVLFLVVDLSCSSCMGALERMKTQRPDARHVALCGGFGRIPDINGWEYYRTSGTDDVYDVQAAPFYFITDSEGIIEVTYTSAL